MAMDFRTYLSTEILSEQRTISYRVVARALKCHVNAAKCMLYEFYEEQHQRKKGGIYATYMIAGTKKLKPATETNGHGNGDANGQKDDGGDEHMALPSSPPPFTSSMMDPSQRSAAENDEEVPQNVPVKTITLVREEDLEKVKAEFEEITSIHLYSLSPATIPDLVALTDVGRGLYADVFSKEDPLLNNKTYGVILNKNVKRRKGKRPILPPAPQPRMLPVKDEGKTEPPPATSKAISATMKPTSTLKREDTTSRPSSRDSASTQDKSKPTLKRDASDIFKAFAKSSQKAKTQPKTEVKSESQDTKMTDAEEEEGESEDEAIFLDTNTRKAGTKRLSEDKQDRADKTAKLRKMMDSDDEAEVKSVDKEVEVAMEEPIEKNDVDKGNGDDGVAWSDSDGEGKKEGKKARIAPESLGPRRKRGKRKVTKKRTMKDEDGFLVTKEEEVWEEFSETDNDEPAARKDEVKKGGFSSMKSSAPASSSQTQMSQGSQKGKGVAAKRASGGGAGNIMSFFGKK